MKTAQVILRQLGGINTSGNDEFLQFRIGHNPAGWTHCKITLTDMDDYTMTLCRFRCHALLKTKDIDGIYFDNLNEVFTDETGLDTSL